MSSATAGTKAEPLSAGLNFRLSLMMFLQYGIWGAWLPLFYSFLTDYRGFSGEEAGLLFGVAAVGALIAPFLAGPICDRYFNIEKFLGLSHIVGAILVWQLAEYSSYTSLVIFGLLYSLIYAPTLPLTNALAFHHLPDRNRDFGKVRVWGTIGWIVVGIVIGQYLFRNFVWTEEELPVMANGVVIERLIAEEGFRSELDIDNVALDVPSALALKNQLGLLSSNGSAEQLRTALSARVMFKKEFLEAQGSRYLAERKGDSFRLSAVLGLILGIFCFFLPKTPPQKSQGSSAFGVAFREVRRAPLLVLFLISFPIACVHQFYFVRTVGFLDALEVRAPWIDSVFGIGGGPMTIGQIAEIFVLASMPFFAARISRKTLLFVGLLAYTLRFAIFAFATDPAAVYPALALHGVCFGCFFFVAFMLIDEHTTSNVRASAQSLYNFIIVGIGTIVGNVAAGFVDTVATVDGSTDYQVLFGIPAAVSGACLVALLLFYPAKPPTPGEEPA